MLLKSGCPKVVKNRVGGEPGIEIETTVVEVDGVAEALAVSEAASGLLDPRDPGIETLGDGIRRAQHDGNQDGPPVILRAPPDLPKRHQSASNLAYRSCSNRPRRGRDIFSGPWSHSYRAPLRPSSLAERSSRWVSFGLPRSE